MTQAEQIYDKYLIHIPDFNNRNPRVLAAIQEALDIREKELEALRDAEVIDKVVETIYSHYKKTGGYTRTAAMLIEKLTGKKWERDKEIDELTAENERLKGMEKRVQELENHFIVFGRNDEPPKQ